MIYYWIYFVYQCFMCWIFDVFCNFMLWDSYIEFVWYIHIPQTLFTGMSTALLGSKMVSQIYFFLFFKAEEPCAAVIIRINEFQGIFNIFTQDFSLFILFVCLDINELNEMFMIGRHRSKFILVIANDDKLLEVNSDENLWKNMLNLKQIIHSGWKVGDKPMVNSSWVITYFYFQKYFEICKSFN